MKGKIRKILMMESVVCPSWFYFSLNNYFRRKVHNPEKIFRPYVKEGDSVLDIGCGPGFFTMGLAALVGNKGKVIAVDIQKKAVDIISEKIKNTDLKKIVIPVLADGKTFRQEYKADFALTFWMLHEVPDKKDFLGEVGKAMHPGALYLLVEPKVHVSEKTFRDEIRIAESCGMEYIKSPEISLSRAALFKIR